MPSFQTAAHKTISCHDVRNAAAFETRGCTHKGHHHNPVERNSIIKTPAFLLTSRNRNHFKKSLSTKKQKNSPAHTKTAAPAKSPGIRRPDATHGWGRATTSLRLSTGADPRTFRAVPSRLLWPSCPPCPRPRRSSLPGPPKPSARRKSEPFGGEENVGGGGERGVGQRNLRELDSTQVRTPTLFHCCFPEAGGELRPLSAGSGSEYSWKGPRTLMLFIPREKAVGGWKRWTAVSTR